MRVIPSEVPWEPGEPIWELPWAASEQELDSYYTDLVNRLYNTADIAQALLVEMFRHQLETERKMQDIESRLSVL